MRQAIGLLLLIGTTITWMRPAEVNAQSVRSGFWWNVGLGYGSLGCDDCGGDREGGLSGNLSFGGTVSPSLLIAAGTSGWSKTESGTTLTVGTLDVRLRYYPSEVGRFFLTGGVGLGSVSADVAGYGSDAENGLGVLVGAGFDVQLSGSASWTLFLNGVAIQAGDVDANFGQFGVGVTFH